MSEAYNERFAKCHCIVSLVGSIGMGIWSYSTNKPNDWVGWNILFAVAVFFALTLIGFEIAIRLGGGTDG